MMRMAMAGLIGLVLGVAIIFTIQRLNPPLGADLEVENEVGLIRFRIPVSCPAVVFSDEALDPISLYLPQPSCDGAQILTQEGEVFVEYPREL